MSKSEQTIIIPGAAASRSRSTQKVLDIDGRFIDAPKVSFSFSPGFSPVPEQLQHRETVSTVFVISLRETVKTVAL
jgi:hypothetical protein